MGDLMLFSLISQFNCGDQFYVEEGTRISGEKPAGLSEVLDRMLYALAQAEIRPTTFLAIGTNYIGKCKKKIL